MEESRKPLAIIAIAFGLIFFVLFVVFALWSINPNFSGGYSLLAAVLSVAFFAVGGVLMPKAPPATPDELGDAHHASGEEIKKWTKLMD